MMNKRGAIRGIIISFVIFVVVLAILFILLPTNFWETITKAATTPINSGTRAFAEAYGGRWGILDFIFGKMPEFLFAFTDSEISPAIITVAVWLLLFITFGDILATFGTFTDWVAWIIGFLIAVVAANLKAVVYFTAFFVGVFSFLGAAALFVGLGAAFVAFIVVNLGLKSWGGWLMQRKAMLHAQKAKAGGTELGGIIKGLKEAGKELEG